MNLNLKTEIPSFRVPHHQNDYFHKTTTHNDEVLFLDQLRISEIILAIFLARTFTSSSVQDNFIKQEIFLAM